MLTVKKAERQRIDAVELWCWKRLLKVPWTSRSNQSILREISLEYSLERLRLKLQYFGHLLQTDHSLGKSVMLAKVHIVKAMIFPVVRYSCKSWTVKKAEHWRIDYYKLWCWRRHLRVPWTVRRSNQSILREINPEYSLKDRWWSWNSSILVI